MTKKFNNIGGNRIPGVDALEAHIAKGCKEFREMQAAKGSFSTSAKDGADTAEDAASDLDASAPEVNI